MNGGAGRRVYGLDSTEATVAAASATAPAIASASAWPRARASFLTRAPRSSKSFPVAMRVPSTDTSLASKPSAPLTNVAVTSQ